MDQDRGTTADRGAGTAGRAADPTTTSDHGTAPDHGRTPGRGTAPSSGIGDPSTLGVEDVLRLLGTSHSGLTPEDAAARLATAGPNAITTHGRTPALVKWLAQFKDWLVLLLLACALVVGWLGDLSTAAVLLVLVLINTTIGFVQEYRAERTMEALSALVHPTAQV
ncbi:cation-transporting P-type ATPase, partial [Actinomyces polynesiensis]|uniref:cation-transporting P-type ATPase n=1 Tax=Actinomyces polynesiensis TaxID=1325934 RepID=UPI0005B76CE8